MTPEQRVQAPIVKYLLGLGCKVIKVVVATKSGNADIVFCYQGHYCEIEVKIPGKTSRKLQLIKARECLDAGGHWAECHSLDEAKEFIARIDDVHSCKR